MACCGQRVSKNKKVIEPLPVIRTVSIPDNFVSVTYIGKYTIRVTGCYTKSKYMFENGVTRLISEKDAVCLFDILPGAFVENVIQSSNTES